jgi:hypothetical protein
MKFAIFGAGIIFACVVLALFRSGNDAMAKCQTTHSYDTCFQLLNR